MDFGSSLTEDRQSLIFRLLRGCRTAAFLIIRKTSFHIRGTKLQKKSHISKQSLMLYSIFSKPFPLTPAISTSCTFRFSFRNLSKTFSKNSRNMIIVSVHFCALLIHFICTPDALLAHFLFSYITNRLVPHVGDLYVTSRLSVGE